MMYGMTAAYGLPGQAPSLGAQSAAAAAAAVPPHLATATITTPVSSHPQMSASEVVPSAMPH